MQQAIDENEKVPVTVKGAYITAAEFFRQEGVKMAALKVATNALKHGLTVATIIDITELDTATIIQLQQELESSGK